MRRAAGNGRERQRSDKPFALDKAAAYREREFARPRGEHVAPERVIQRPRRRAVGQIQPPDLQCVALGTFAVNHSLSVRGESRTANATATERQLLERWSGGARSSKTPMATPSASTANANVAAMAFRRTRDDPPPVGATTVESRSCRKRERQVTRRLKPILTILFETALDDRNCGRRELGVQRQRVGRISCSTAAIIWMLDGR